MVLLGHEIAYCSQVVRYAAEARGIRWREHPVDITRHEQYESWYLKFNPKGYVPTMLVGPSNKVVVESIDIAEHLDTIGEQLVPKSGEAAERYQQLRQLHQDWEVGVFTYGCSQKESFLVRTFLPRHFATSLVKLEQQMGRNIADAKVLTLLRDKHTSQVELWIAANDRKRVGLARHQAIAMLKQCDEWLGSSSYLCGHEFTLADVLFSTALGRMQHVAGFWRKEVLSRPKVLAYFARAEQTDAYKNAKVGIFMPSVTNTVFHSSMAVLVFVLGAVVAELSQIFGLGHGAT